MTMILPREVLEMPAMLTAENNTQQQSLHTRDLPEEAPQGRSLSAGLALLFARDLLIEDEVCGGDDEVFVFCPRAFSGSPGVG